MPCKLQVFGGKENMLIDLSKERNKFEILINILLFFQHLVNMIEEFNLGSHYSKTIDYENVRITLLHGSVIISNIQICFILL